MAHEHRYQVAVEWTGNRGEGTASYRGYGRDHSIRIEGKPELAGSSDPAFRGDPARHNPEDLFVASLSTCHMLWYLHLCSEAGVVVTGYRDRAEGVMETGADGGGRFRSVTLRPEVTIAPGSDADKARALHKPANARCFIANSVNCPVGHEPTVTVGG